MTPSDGALALVLTLAPGVTRTWLGLKGSIGETQLTDAPLIDALEDGATLALLLAVGTPRAGHDVRGVLEVLHARRMLAWQVRDSDGNAWATLVPLWRDVPLAVPEGSTGPLRLSRFALMRMSDDAWVLESGRSPYAASLSPEAAAAIASGEGQPELHALLLMAGFLDDSDDDGPVRYWEFHDRYFASRSRMDIDPSGGTFRFADIHDPPLPETHPPHRDEMISLPVPPAQDGGPGLWEVSERRRTVRDVSDDPVSLDALGSLLWHTLRVTGANPRDPGVRESYDRIRRPVPSSGGTHSIGLWLWCNNVEDVPPGAWWYDPWDHALRLVSDDPRLRFRQPSPVNGILMSRFGRLAWKYERIAYALALKDAGVILHALQLSAVALGLAMCPIGGGLSAPLLHALGLSEDEYAPVGDFWIGNPR